MVFKVHGLLIDFFLTIPVMIALVERSFSKLKLINTYIQTISQE